MRTFLSILLSIAVSAASGCAARDASYDPSSFHFKGVVVPPDIVPPQHARGENVTGVYTLAALDGSSCCLIASHATFSVRKARFATGLHVNVFVQDTAFFRAHPQELTVTFLKAGRSQKSGTLGAGFHEIVAAVPVSMRALRGDIPIRLDCSVDYSPLLAHEGADPRHFCAVLTSIYFE